MCSPFLQPRPAIDTLQDKDCITFENYQADTTILMSKTSCILYLAKTDNRTRYMCRFSEAWERKSISKSQYNLSDFSFLYKLYWLQCWLHHHLQTHNFLLATSLNRHQIYMYMYVPHSQISTRHTKTLGAACMFESQDGWTQRSFKLAQNQLVRNQLFQFSVRC